MRASLIITTYNWPGALRSVLNSVMKQTRLPDEVIIADDGSGAETRKLVNQFQRTFPVPLIHSWQEDLGFRAARSRNLAVSKSSGDYLIFLDGDMILHDHFVEDHLAFARSQTWVQGVRAKISELGSQAILSDIDFSPLKPFDDRLKSKRYSIRSSFLRGIFSGYRRFAKLRMAQTCNLALGRDSFFLVNGFNEDFVGWGREDSEFVCRLLNAGVQRRDLRFSAVAYHLHHDGNSRSALDLNHQIYMATLRQGLTWCENGVSNHVSAKT